MNSATETVLNKILRVTEVYTTLYRALQQTTAVLGIAALCVFFFLSVFVQFFVGMYLQSCPALNASLLIKIIE